MKILLDTPTILWWWASPDRLSPAAFEKLSHPESEIFVSSVSIGEMIWRQKNEALTLPEGMLEELPDHLAAERWTELPLRIAHTVQASQFVNGPTDPFDSLLAAQASVEKMKLVTPDPAFKSLPGVSVLW